VKLAAANPKWLGTVSGREGVGVSFDCPCARCHNRDDRQRINVYIDPPFDGGAPISPAWERSGDTFDSLTLKPSIILRIGDGKGGMVEHWHGFVTAGELRSC
jgi:hypothetical protein